MPRIRTLFALLALVLLTAAALAGCGGDGGSSDEDPDTVLEETFNNDTQVSSGNLDLGINMAAGDQGSFEANLSGPFQGEEGDPTVLPQLDWTVTASGSGAGQQFDFEGGLIATEDNAYVEYQGETYEVGSDTFQQFKQSFEQQAAAQQSNQGDAAASFKEGCEQAIEQQGGDPSACDFDVTAWFTNLSNEGTEDVEGTSTVHVAGDLDVQQMLDDLVGLAESIPNAQTVDPAQLNQVQDAIQDASFDVYSGEDDSILRRLSFNLSIDPSAVAAATPVPVDSVDIGFDATISGVNEPQTIEAPSGAKPIDQLLQQFGLGGLGPLGGLGGSGLGG